MEESEMIKARIIETGQVIHVVFHDHVRTMDGETEIWRDLKSHNLYRSKDLDFNNLTSSVEDVKEKFLHHASPEYIERLRHTYMGQAMQSLIQSGVFPIDDKHDVSMHVIARKAWEMADALIYEIFKDRRPVASDIGNCCKEG